MNADAEPNLVQAVVAVGLKAVDVERHPAQAVAEGPIGRSLQRERRIVQIVTPFGVRGERFGLAERLSINMRRRRGEPNRVQAETVGNRPMGRRIVRIEAMNQKLPFSRLPLIGCSCVCQNSPIGTSASASIRRPSAIAEAQP